MKFQVPQFIETEDRIIGPLTIRQFLFIAAGGALIFILFFLLKFIFWLTASLLIGTLSLALAFLKINGQPLPQILLSAIFFMSRPRLFLWRRKIEEKIIEIPNIENFSKITVGTKKRTGLDFLKTTLETGSRAVPARETPQISRITRQQPEVAPQLPPLEAQPPLPLREETTRQAQTIAGLPRSPEATSQSDKPLETASLAIQVSIRPQLVEELPSAPPAPTPAQAPIQQAPLEQKQPAAMNYETLPQPSLSARGRIGLLADESQDATKQSRAITELPRFARNDKAGEKETPGTFSSLMGKIKSFSFHKNKTPPQKTDGILPPAITPEAQPSEETQPSAPTWLRQNSSFMPGRHPGFVGDHDPALPTPDQPKKSSEKVVITLKDGSKQKVKRVDY